MARKRLYRLESLEPIADKVWRFLFELQTRRHKKFVRLDYCELVRGMERRFGAPRPTVGHVAESLLLLARKRRIFAKGDGYYGGDRKMIYVLAQPPEETEYVVDKAEPGIANRAAGGGLDADTGADDHDHPVGQPGEPPGVAGGAEGLADVAGSGIPGLDGIGIESHHVVCPG